MFNKKTPLLLLFVIAKFILQYQLIDPSYDLHRDEYLHLDQAKHLAWGFDSVPPFSSWIAFIISTLGNSVFWVKFFPALFGALTMVVVWKAIERLGGGVFALVLAALALLLSVLLRINMLFQPNSFDILAWTFFYYCTLVFIQTENNKWLYAGAVIFAIGFLNKYNIAFLLMGILPALLLTKFREVFVNLHLYVALLLALLLLMPNIFWQFKNGLPVIHHMKELASTQLVNVSRLNFIKEQLLFFAGSFFIIVIAWLSFFMYPPFRKFKLLFWAYVFTMLLFIYLKAKSYYAIGAYPLFFAFGAVYLEQLLSKRWLKYLRPVALLLPLVFSIIIFRIGFPTAGAATLAKRSEQYRQFGLLRWEDGKDHSLPQDFADMLGWTELAKKVDAVYETIPDKAHTIVYCDNYGLAGAINYYSAYKNINAVSMSADYVDWFPPASTEVKHVILVKDLYDDDTARKKELPLFRSVTLKGRIENMYAREKGTAIYLLLDANVPIMPYFTKDIREVKQERNFFH